MAYLIKDPVSKDTHKNIENDANKNISENTVLNKAVDNIANAGNKGVNVYLVGMDASYPTSNSNTGSQKDNTNDLGNGIAGDGVNNSTSSGSNSSSNNNINTPIYNANTSHLTNRTSFNKNPEIVQVRSYVAPYTQIPLTYDSSENKVYLGGREVPVSYISNDGRSYALKEDVDAILNDLRYSNPYSKDAIIQRVVDSGNDIYDAVNKLKKREKFSYDYRRDPVYKAYVNQYDSMRDSAIRDAISSSVARTGGYMNSNAASVAYQTAAEYDRMKANIIPTLEAQAYQRYASENQLDNASYTAIGNMVNSYMGNMAGLYGQQDNNDLSKYSFDKTLEQNDILSKADYDRWYKEYLLDLDRLGLSEKQLDFSIWYQTTVLDKKYPGTSSDLKSNNYSGNNNSGYYNFTFE